MKRRPTVFFCDMGFSNFTVDTKGDIYACHLLVGIQEFKIGNICENSKQLKKKILQEGEMLYKKIANKLRYTECQNCYLKYYCHDCLARRYLLNGEIKISFEKL
ncbi:MAG: SPASM domain-containing protein [Caldanaerobacter subterraneus]|nr:SPASM domain-containing protein [Caldanaerobacter subterraneus]